MYILSFEVIFCQTLYTGILELLLYKVESRKLEYSLKFNVLIWFQLKFSIWDLTWKLKTLICMYGTSFVTQVINVLLKVCKLKSHNFIGVLGHMFHVCHSVNVVIRLIFFCEGGGGIFPINIQLWKWKLPKCKIFYIYNKWIKKKSWRVPLLLKFNFRCLLFFRFHEIFMPPAWRVCGGHLVIRSSVCLSVCLSVRNSIALTNKVQYLKFGWWYSNQTLIVSSSMGSSHFTDITCPWGWGGVKMLGLRDFCHILTLLPPGASVFHKHMSSFTLWHLL